MKRRLLGLVICLSLVLSLLPTLSFAAENDDPVYKYTEVQHEGAWTTNDTYAGKNYYVYDSLDEEYYPVQFETNTALYDATESKGWSINNATGAGHEYYHSVDKDDMRQVVTTGFTRYLAFNSQLPSNMRDQRADVLSGFRDPRDYTEYDINTHLYIEFNGHFYELYGQKDAYTAIGADEYGTDYWQGGYRQRMLYYPNGKSNAFTVLKMGHTQDGEDTVGSSWSFIGGGCNYYVGMDIYKGSGSYGLGYKTAGTANTRNTGSILNLSATQFSSDTVNSYDSNTTIWNGVLYYRNNHSGTSRLYYEAKDGTEKQLAQRTLIYGDTVYNGKLYTKEVDNDKMPVTDRDPGDKTIEVDSNTTIWNPGRQSTTDNLKLSKELSENEQGSFDLTMQSYSTAASRRINVTEKVPTDFVVVVDQSGSMINPVDMPTGYNAVSGTKTLEDIADGSYYIKADDGNYYRVYATRDYLMEYHPAETKWTKNIIEDAGYDLSWFQGEDEATFSQANQYYYKTSDNIYRPITVTAEGKLGTYYVRFHYTDASGQEQTFQRPSKPVYKNVFGSDTSKYKEGSFLYGAVNAAVLAAYPSSNAYTYSEFLGVTTGMYVNYPMFTRHVGYTKLCYRDVNGVEHVVKPISGAEVAEYCNSSGQAVTTQGGSTRYNYNKLYSPSGTKTRLSALTEALTQFAQAVANEKDTKTGVADKVDNRIAIVGFSSDTDSSNRYNNTEILTGTNLTVSGKNGKQMVDATVDDYASALVPATDGTAGNVNQKITDAISAITANGGTQPEYGFQMAESILNNRTETTYNMVTDNNREVQRNKIVIFFTDGQPGDNSLANQYKEANDVVEKAKRVKDTGATVFSIGVFGESDGNPLTYYDATSTGYAPSSWQYEGGWVDNYQSGNTYYRMRRQWRPNNAEGYTPTPNDTIFDYMSVVSSNYPNANKFIDDDWLNGTKDDQGNYVFTGTYTDATDGAAVRDKEHAAANNDYYRMAANQETLVVAFKQAVSYSSTMQQSSSSVVLDESAVFKDVINTDDFDISKATYSVFWQPIKVNETVDPTTESMIEEDSTKNVEEKISKRAVPANGEIVYSGFDYSANYVSLAKNTGYKLVVKVEGLVPKTFDAEIKTNADPSETSYACGIYGAGKTVPEISVQSPKLTVLKPSTSYVVDYNLPFIIAHGLNGTADIKSKQETNGVFTFGEPDLLAAAASGNKELAQKDNPTSDDAVYSIMSFHNDGLNVVDGQIVYDPADINITVNGAFSAVDHATITGNHVEDGPNAERRTRDVYMIPASSIYMSDKTMLVHPPVEIEDGHGYNAQINDTIAKSTTPVLKELYFTFYGTGIDAYCTTDDTSGFVQAAVFRGAGKDACVIGNREGKAVTVKNYSAKERYNVPSISFTNLPKGTYTLKVYVSGNGTVEAPLYKINGVRVYSPQESGSQAEAMLNGGTYDGTEHDASIDANATYLNLRKLLLNEKGAFKVNNEIPDGEVDISAITGVLYLDNAENLSTTWNDEEGNPVSRFVDNFDAYKHDGPKNEIYLDENQGITFQMDVSKFDEKTKVYIGASAPETGSGTVLVNGEAIQPSVNSVMDMYYPIPFNLDNAVDDKLSVTISNGGKSLISLTNLKITGVDNLLGVSASSSEEEVSAASRAFFAPVTMKTVRMASNKGIDPEGDNGGTEIPSLTEEPAVTDDPTETEEPGSGGGLVIDEPEETETPAPTPAVSPEPTDATENPIQKAIKSIVNSISSFFKNIFRR